MPKNTVTEATKSKMRTKSTRKPLRDVSNAKTAVKSANFIKKSSQDEGRTGDYSLDHLLLVHSDLSSLLRQIDDLVVQALKVTSNKGRQEIKQFADVLSDIQTSLKPWIPKFQKVLSSQSIRSESKSEKSMERTVVCEPKQSTNAVIGSPAQTQWESLISPSPLVSWRAECNTEGGRQLFLLTPLPQKKAMSSKCKASSIRALEDITSDHEIAPSVCISDSVRNLGNDLPESVLPNPNPDKALDTQVTKAPKTNCSMFVMTPCLKMSPPKSCILLEPASALYSKKNKAVHPSTPFPARVHAATPFPSRVENHSEFLDSESSSSSQSSDDLKVKYPELLGIKTDNLGKRTVAEDPPSWMVSPPKTCAIMEPSDEKLLKSCLVPKTTATNNQQQDLSSVMRKECQGGKVDLAESTPMIKEPMSSFRMGKLPGENTLKKELWTRFEAASIHGSRFNGSVVQYSSTKGFLDILDEALDA